MKALTIIEPWASCILFHGKDIENRSCRFPHRLINLPIAIHAGKKFDDYGQRILKKNRGIEIKELLPAGHIVAIAHVTKTTVSKPTESKNPWAIPGFFYWHTVVDHILETPIPARGQLGLWEVPPEVAAEINNQLYKHR